MPKHLIRKLLPDHESFRDHKALWLFGRLIHDPNLWHLNRRSVSWAFFVGLLCACLPVFPQMLLAVALAIILRANLSIALALVWLNNPVTIPPIFYTAYLIGCWLLGERPAFDGFQMSMEWVQSVFSQVWRPMLLGGTVEGLTLGALGYAAMRGFWRWHVVRELKRRQARRELQGQAAL